MGNTKAGQSSEHSAPLTSFKKILVAVDGSEKSNRAAETAVDLAQKYGAELIVLHVIPRPGYNYLPYFPTGPPPAPNAYNDYYEYAKKAAEAYLGKAISIAKGKKVNVKGEVREAVQSAVQGITEHAKNENVDLIVVGTRGLGGFKKLLVGSVSSGVIANAHCPVLVVR